MRAVIQRVKRAEVRFEGGGPEAIGPGLLVFLGIHKSDTEDDLEWLAHKILQLRVFEDGEGKMNHSLMEAGGDLMVISQFTLFGNMRKGSRPSFNNAGPPERAIPLYETSLAWFEERLGKRVARGSFGAYMEIDAANDGPVTLILDTHEKRF